ncbi:YbaB/EbfC family nucleoid-associated protein [Nocardia sp. CA-135953]|uniref:YbaB/EbfC family nucleoid-associated protein n=1 Tax=unclassified Nocardia TaxID=2637762 RepID=UPI003D96CDAC
MSDIHPDVQAALDAARELRHRIADMRERIDGIRARRPSPSGAIIPEVDAMGRLTDLFMAPGTVDRLTNQELVTEIMAAIRESTADAARQYQSVMEAVPPPEPFESTGPSGPVGPSVPPPATAGAVPS